MSYNLDAKMAEMEADYQAACDAEYQASCEAAYQAYLAKGDDWYNPYERWTYDDEEE